MSLTLHIGTPEDAEELGTLLTKAWQESYQGVVAQDVLDNLDPIERAARTKSQMEDPNNRGICILARWHGELAGFGAYGPQNYEDLQAQAPFEIYAMYLLEKFKGQGIAQNVMHRMMQKIKELGGHKATVWTFADNPRARKFYESSGAAYLKSGIFTIRQNQQEVGQVCYIWEDINRALTLLEQKIAS